MTEMSRAERRAAQRQEKDEDQGRRQWEASWPGQAEAAHKAGLRFFQAAAPVGAKSYVGVIDRVNQNRSTALDTQAGPAEIAAIEAQGWVLFDIGYVYEQTGQMSRDKLMSSGQQTTTLGRIIGLYTFRRQADASA